MKLMINSKNIINTILVLLIIVFLFLIYKNANIFFYASLLFLFLTIIKCKISFFSLKSIIIVYTLFPFFFKFNFNYCYGIFEEINNKYYLLACLGIFVYLFIWYLIYNCTNLLELEKKIINKNDNLGLKISKVMSFFAIVFTLVRFPTLPFLKEYDRFVSLLPGNSWNHLAILFMAIALPEIKNSKIIKFSFLFLMLWFLGHYERVDCIGLISLLLINALSKTKITIKSILKISLVAITIFISFTIIEMVRQKNKINLNSIPQKVLVHSTASDVAYTYGRALEYETTKSHLYGITYLKYIIEVIPMLEYKNSSENILNNNYYTVGGEFLLNEPYMNFGLIGIVIFIMLELLFFLLVFRDNKYYCKYAYYVLIFSVFRIVWYGISYIETTLIIYIPAIILFIYILKFFEKRCGNNVKN